MINVYESIEKNKRKSFLLIFLFLLFIGFVTYSIVIYLGYTAKEAFFIAVLFSFFSTFLNYWYSDKIILSILKARSPKQEEEKIFRQVTENICIAAQIPLPKLYVIEDSAPNAFATGRDENHSVICVTTGLLDKLNRTELEGVIAHEVSHIKNQDTRLMTIVTITIGIITLITDMILRGNFGRKNKKEVNPLLLIIGFFLIIFSPLIGKIIQFSISRQREFLADAGSAFLTRQPSGLISALKKISQDPEPLEVANKATSHLFIINPFKEKNKKTSSVGWFSKLFNTHPPVEERIAALEKML